MTEINLGLIIPKGGSAILCSKLHPCVHRDLILRGLTFNPQEALASKIVDDIIPGDKLLSTALEMAKSLMKYGENQKVHQQLKVSTYYDTIKTNELADVSNYFMSDAQTLNKNPNI